MEAAGNIPSGTRRFLLETVKLWLIGGVIMTLIIGNPANLYEKGILLKSFLINGLATVVFWQGNAYLSNLPDRWINWVDAPFKRLLLTLGIMIVFTTAASVMITCLYYTEIYGWELRTFFARLDIGAVLPTLIITFGISAFMHGRGFLLELKRSIVEAESLKKQQLEARYEALKNQVNPHFLFNSLNVLSGLVHKDADESERFIHRLSSVLRYILESKDRNTVSLEEELQMLDAYLSMMKIRFGEGFRYVIDAPDPTGYEIAPLCLQMLVENALKHNESSKQYPLEIGIFLDGESYIHVRNNLRKKEQIQASSGIGLANIRSRYQFLTDRQVRVAESDGEFSVGIPLISAKQPAL
ncbi:MAG TPA: histidine kinase [Flavilitoribacter sp.]|nr:histidine kinase [Flavilitoribacter sp.]